MSTTSANDQSAAPRPLNCFLLYRLHKQKEIVEKCTGANHRDISKIIAKWWKEAPEDEKRIYREKARLRKIQHNKLYPNYKYTPKKKVIPKRVYVRKNKKEQFTSREKENNTIMELIYEDAHALKLIPPPYYKSKLDSVKTKPTTSRKRVLTRNLNNVQGSSMNEEADIFFKKESAEFDPSHFDRSFTPSSVSSPGSVTENIFDSPQMKRSNLVSPFTENYSECDATSPHSEDSNLTLGYASLDGFQPMQQNFECLSPFDILNTPCINETNAYVPIAGEFQQQPVDYFHFDHSPAVVENKFTSDPFNFTWDESVDLYQHEQFVPAVPIMGLQQIIQHIQFINPALLLM